MYHLHDFGCLCMGCMTCMTHPPRAVRWLRACTIATVPFVKCAKPEATSFLGDVIAPALVVLKSAYTYHHAIAKMITKNNRSRARTFSKKGGLDLICCMTFIHLGTLTALHPREELRDVLLPYRGVARRFWHGRLLRVGGIGGFHHGFLERRQT